MPKKTPRLTAATALEEAVRRVGGPGAAMRVLGVSVSTYYKYRRAGAVKLAKPCLRLAKASGVPAELLAGGLD